MNQDVRVEYGPIRVVDRALEINVDYSNENYKVVGKIVRYARSSLAHG